MKKMYALLNFWKTNPNTGPIHIDKISTDLEMLQKLEDSPKTEVVLLYKDKADGKWYFSRDFDNPIKTFKADKELVESMI